MTSLEIDNLEFSWGNDSDQASIGPINLKVNIGETVGVFGRSGSGKSTLLRLLKGELQPKHGKIDICPHSHRIYHDQIQKLIPWLSARKNITVNLDHIKNPLSAEEIAKLFDKFGLSAYLDRDATKLSGGQRARVALARSLIEPSDLLLLDEPFAGIDVRTQNALVAEIARSSCGRITLLSSHDPGLLIEICDKVLCLVEENGKIVSQEFFIDPEIRQLNAADRKQSEQYLGEVQRLLGSLYV